LKRFVLLALPLLLALFALFNVGLELAGYEPELGPLVGRPAGGFGLPGGWVIATWGIESIALSALYLLIVGPAVPRFSSGLLAGWIAWVFRGPLLVITAVGYGGLAHGPWWRLSLRWLVLYTLAGALLGALGSLLGRPATPAHSRPVDPKPPAPRGLGDSSPPSSHSTASTRATTS
jgi:hypothetical protein